MSNSKSIFKQGSKTYFYSSLFFPRIVKEKIFTFYSFVRTIDDLVDAPIPNETEFYKQWKAFKNPIENNREKYKITDSMLKLVNETGIKKEWIESFFKSMETDLKKHKTLTKDEFDTYVYGSAEVIGLCLCSIMKISDEATSFARALGHAMQHINFIRDWNEDRLLGRGYLYDIGNLKNPWPNQIANWTKKDKDQFVIFIRAHIQEAKSETKYAERGYRYLPTNYLIPIKTSMDMYLWTLNIIYKNPLILLKKKVKPSIARILIKGIMESINVYFSRSNNTSQVFRRKS